MTSQTPRERTCPALAALAVITLGLGLLLMPKPANAAFNECVTDEEAMAKCAPFGTDVLGRASSPKAYCKMNIAFCNVEGDQDPES